MKNFKTFLISIILVLITAVMVKNYYDINKLKEHHSINQPKYSYTYDCLKEAEITYWDYKVALVNEVQNYITQIAPSSNLRGYAIVEECERYDVDVCFVLAQGEIESHFGTKGVGAKLNNVFNVGVFDNLTSEDVNKTYKYSYPNQSIEPYLKLITNKYLVNKLEDDLMQKYTDINGNRYASDKNYEAKLRDKYNSICSSTKIDEYEDMMNAYATKCNR